MIRACLVASLTAAAIFIAAPTHAQTVVGDPATTPVEGRTYPYLDLIRLAVPGVVKEGDAYRTGAPLELRHIDGDRERTVKIAEGTPMGAPMALPVQSEGHRRVAMMLDLGAAPDSAEGIAMLALFDVDHEPKLLDTANVAYDRLTGFADPPNLTLWDGSTPLLISSGHWNSNQTYEFYAMVDLHSDRLRLIDSLFMLSDHGCGYERVLRPRFMVTGSPKEPAIRATVTEIVKRLEESCQGQPLPKAGKRKISVTYTWQPKDQRFVKSSNAFERLADEMETRF